MRCSSSIMVFVLVGAFSLPSISFPDGEDEFSACRPVDYTCGAARYEVKYPFRVDGSAPFCGHPSFVLRCPDNSMLLTTIGGKDYVVNSIDYDTHTFNLTDKSFAGNDQSCKAFSKYTIFDHRLLGYTDAVATIPVLFNCSPRTGVTLTGLGNVSCFDGDHGRYQSFVVTPTWHGDMGELDCTDLVTLPISGYGYTYDAAYDFIGAFRRGFELRWKAGDGWCKNCTDSNGICGNNGTLAGGRACFCSNSGSVGGICVRGTNSKTGSKDMKIKIGKTGSKDMKSKIGNHSLTIGLISGSGGLLFACALLVIYLRSSSEYCNSVTFWKKNDNDQNIEDFLLKCGNMAPKRYTYADLKRITKSFHEKLGQGGYGTVFKGTLANGHEVAVKVLRESKGNGDEFLNEVSSIGRTSHVNIVSLLGFCYERSKRALIYDFMCNGSLEKFVYSMEPRTTLEWERLYKIAIGIARGLEYLHSGCNTRIVHFDIKPHNILLDTDFCPKISDFGLAKLCLKKESIISTAGFRGTIGYIAPEVFSRNFGDVSSKSDVYSYGMMVLEMVGGRKNATMDAERSCETYFPHWIYEHLMHHGDMQACGVTAETEESARKMTIVGLWCIQTNPQDRPTITRVIEMLEGNVDDLDVPPKQYLSTPLRSLVGTSSIHDGCWNDDRPSGHEPNTL